jgi:hypothetical protein
MMAEEEQPNEKKLRNSDKQLHNRAAKPGDASDEANTEDDNLERRFGVKNGVYDWYGPTGKLHSAPLREGGGVRLDEGNSGPECNIFYIKVSKWLSMSVLFAGGYNPLNDNA